MPAGNSSKAGCQNERPGPQAGKQTGSRLAPATKIELRIMDAGCRKSEH